MQTTRRYIPGLGAGGALQDISFRGRKSTDTVCASAGMQQVVMDTELFKRGITHTGTGPATIEQAGYYLFGGSVEWAAAGGEHRTQISLRATLSGTPYDCALGGDHVGLNKAPRLCVATLAYFNVGDTVELYERSDYVTGNTAKGGGAHTQTLWLLRLGGADLVCCRAYSDATLLIPNGAETSLIFNQETFDVGGWRSGSSTDFTVPEAGTYIMGCSVEWPIPGVASFRRGLLIDVGGSNVALKDDGGGPGSLATVGGVVTIQGLAAGNVIKVQAWQNSGVGQTLPVGSAYGGSQQFWIAKLPAAAGAAREVRQERFHQRRRFPATSGGDMYSALTAAVVCASGSLVTCPLGDAGGLIAGEAFGSFDAATDTFTFTKAGKYLVHIQGYWATASACLRYIRLLHNGSPTMESGDVANPNDVSAAYGITLISAAVGDTLQLKLFQDSGSNKNYSGPDIFRIYKVAG